MVPVTADRWDDLARLFGPSGTYSNCWCMWWRLPSRAWDEAGGEGRRRAFAAIVDAGSEPGLLAYADADPVGWCAVAPRTEFARLTSPRARTFRPFDETPTWVINCFFIHKAHRGRGVATALLDAAIEYAVGHGATVLEGYPVDLATARRDADVFTGTLSMFRRAGFTEVDRRNGRPLVRLLV